MTSDRVHRMVRQWERELPEVATPEIELAKRLGFAAAAIAQVGAGALAQLDLDPGEYDVLATLLRQGPPYELKPADLARAELVTPSGMTKRVDRLERRGLVARRPAEGDRRVLLVALTDEGVDVARTAVLQHSAAIRDELLRLDRGALDRALSGLRDLGLGV